MLTTFLVRWQNLLQACCRDQLKLHFRQCALTTMKDFRSQQVERDNYIDAVSQTASLHKRLSPKCFVALIILLAVSQMYQAFPSLQRCRGDWAVCEMVKSYLRDRQNYAQKMKPIRLARQAQARDLQLVVPLPSVHRHPTDGMLR